MENKKSYYAIIPANVRYAKIPDKAKLLYGEITALCNEKGYCWASNNYFAQLYDVHKNTISRLISILAKNEFIEIELIKKDGKEVLRKMFIGIRKNEVGYTQNCLGGIRKNAEENITINIKENTKRNGINSERVSNGGIVKSLTDNFSLEDMTKYGEEKLLPLKVIKDYKEAYTLWIQEKPTDKNRQGRDLKATVKNWLLRDLKCGKIKPELTPMQEMEEEIKRLGGTLL